LFTALLIGGLIFLGVAARRCTAIAALLRRDYVLSSALAMFLNTSFRFKVRKSGLSKVFTHPVAAFLEKWIKLLFVPFQPFAECKVVEESHVFSKVDIGEPLVCNPLPAV
jgi:hypothetical protein